MPSVPTKVRLLNRLPTLDLGGGDYSSCPVPVIAGSTKFGCVGGESPFTTIGSPYIKVEAEHVWGQAMADIIPNGMAPQTATDKAFRRLDAIVADYLIHQA